ncbi:hypothetical protein BSQ97_01755 [Serratia proteamaculans]|nr:hypothetical protein BSQ97_01755 [Serratia proteamaculans]
MSDVAVYGYLLGWQKSAKDQSSKVRKVFPSLDRIGSDLRISPDTAKRAVNILEKRGFLTRTRPNRRMSYLYTVVELDDLPSVAPAAEPQEFNQPTEQGPANDRDSQTERQATHDDQNSHDPVEIVKPDINPDSPADVVPKLKAVPVPAVQGDDEFSIWCSVAERDQLKIPVIDILKGCNGDRDKAAASVKLMIDHTRKRRKEEQQRQIEHLVNEDTSAYSLLDEEEEIPY